MLPLDGRIVRPWPGGVDGPMEIAVHAHPLRVQTEPHPRREGPNPICRTTYNPQQLYIPCSCGQYLYWNEARIRELAKHRPKAA